MTCLGSGKIIGSVNKKNACTFVLPRLQQNQTKKQGRHRFVPALNNALTRNYSNQLLTILIT